MSTYVEKIADEVEQTSDTQTASPREPSRTLGSEETAIPLQTEQEITSVSGAEQEDETKKDR